MAGKKKSNQEPIEDPKSEEVVEDTAAESGAETQEESIDPTASEEEVIFEAEAEAARRVLAQVEPSSSTRERQALLAGWRTAPDVVS